MPNQPPPADDQKSASATKATTFNLPPQLLLALDALADKQGVSKSAALSQLLGYAIDEQQKIANQQKSQKVTLSVRVDVDTAEQLKKVAKTEGVSINVLAATCIEHAMMTLADVAAEGAVDIMYKKLRAEVTGQRDEIKLQAHRHAHLIIRSILESLQNRIIMSTMLQAMGYPAADIRELNASALTKSIDQLRQQPPIMREAINDLLLSQEQKEQEMQRIYELEQERRATGYYDTPENLRQSQGTGWDDVDDEGDDDE